MFNKLDILRKEFLCLQKWLHDIFPSTPLIHLQNNCVKNKFLPSTLLYEHIISKPVQYYHSLFQISFKLKLTTALKASNILHAESKTKR